MMSTVRISLCELPNMLQQRLPMETKGRMNAGCQGLEDSKRGAAVQGVQSLGSARCKAPGALAHKHVKELGTTEQCPSKGEGRQFCALFYNQNLKTSTSCSNINQQCILIVILCFRELVSFVEPRLSLSTHSNTTVKVCQQTNSNFSKTITAH